VQISRVITLFFQRFLAISQCSLGNCERYP
jgi:hypothetical protein